MHPLTLFPSLLTFGLLSPVLLRIAVSAFIVHLGLKRYQKKSGSEYDLLAMFYMVVSIFLFLGLYTQIAALLGIAVLKFDFYSNFWKNRKSSPVSKETYFLYIIPLIILLGLLLTGPGLFAFDLPL